MDGYFDLGGLVDREFAVVECSYLGPWVEKGKDDEA
jgi:hypothetical protein